MTGPKRVRRGPARRRPVWVLGGSTLLVALVLTWLLSPNGARAAGEPGSQLGSYQLSASGAGLQASYASAGSSTATAEGEVPWADSLLDSTPFGEGLASVAWPGAIPANAGTTAVVLGVPLPSNYADDLNDPVRAQAETGGQAQVTNNAYPGTTMVASATADKVTADGNVDSTVGPASGFTTGDVHSSSSAALTGPAAATVDAASQVTNLSLAGGLITIKSVISQATATSNGVTGHSSGGTVVSGVSVAGVPASIDQDGLHLQSTGADAGPAVAAANKALAASSVQVLPAAPVHTSAAGNVTYTAASILITWSPGGQGLFTVDLGGVGVAVAATPGFASSSTGPATVGGTVTANPSQPAAPGPVSSGSGAVASGAAGDLTGPGGGSTGPGGGLSAGGAGPSPAAAAGAPGAGASGSAAAASPGSGQATGVPSLLAAVSKPVSVGWIVLAALASLLVVGGLIGVPDRVLDDEASTCRLEEAR